MSHHEIPSISPSQLSIELQGNEPPMLLDVREANELEISKLPNVIHIPLGELPNHTEGLLKTADWVIICRSGVRSAQATRYLLGLGFASVRNLTGGMNGYAKDVNRSLPVY